MESIKRNCNILEVFLDTLHGKGKDKDFDELLQKL